MTVTTRLTAALAGALLPTTLLAGPVERELRNRGSDIVAPVSRPDDGKTSVPKDVLSVDLKGLNASSAPRPDPASQNEVTLPSPRGAEASPEIQDRSQFERATDKNEEKPDSLPSGRVEAKSEDDDAEASNTEAETAENPRPQRTLDPQCVSRLATRSDAATVPSPKGQYPQCTIQQPVAIFALYGTLPVTLSSTATLDCVLATALADFVQFRAQPLAQIHLETQLTKIVAGPGFQCRRRNNRPTGKLSEHAFGYGWDILAFEFADGTRINVRDPAQMAEREAAYFTAARKGACDYFTTVLGPGSDGFHGDHLHVDLGRSINNPDPYRICK
ncbi:MAG: extensin family protein [Pseudomonadota bacterium]